MNSPFSTDLLSQLSQIDGPAMANAIETFNVRLRNEGFTRDEVTRLSPGLSPMVGHAVTITVRTDSPPTGAGFYLDRTDWWDAILNTPAPRIVVIQDTSEKMGLGALLGEVHVSILQALGCTGAVTNGAVRDLPAVQALRFPLFARGLSVSHAYAHIVAVGKTVEIGGLKIEPGALLHGDEHGLQTIPAEIAVQLPAVAARLAAEEEALLQQLRRPGATIDDLRAAVTHHHT